MRKKKKTFVCLLCVSMTLGMAACGSRGEGAPQNTAPPASGPVDVGGGDGEEETVVRDYSVDYEGIAAAEISAEVSVHDPSVVKAGGRYYIFGSHMTAAVSDDLRHWTSLGDGYRADNPVYRGLLENADAFAYAGSRDSLNPTDDGGWHVWAPDVVYNKSAGLYFLYFCMSSTWNTSNLCYAVSENVEGPYEWKGALLYSGLKESNLDATDVTGYVDRDTAKKKYIRPDGGYNFDRYPNAIDPSVFYDGDGRLWMVYGSWSGGIFLLEMDPATGTVIHPEADEERRVDPYFGRKLMGGRHTSIEGPYILYDEESGFYYLFVSYGGLVRTGGYQIRVFRSETVDGEYVDMNGDCPLDTGNLRQSPYGLKLSGNYFLPSLKRAYMATGHNSAFIDDDGKRYIVNHTRFDNGTEYHEPRVHQFIVNKEGWPCMLPYATDGETAAADGYTRQETAGKYYVINQGTYISAEIAEPFILYLEEDGRVYGDGVEGDWKAEDGTCFMKISYGGLEYSGVFCRMNDEAGTQVMTFSAVGGNESVWGRREENGEK